MTSLPIRWVRAARDIPAAARRAPRLRNDPGVSGRQDRKRANLSA
jgi:hypothetical protein